MVNILDRRSKIAGAERLVRPMFIWEPVPDLCVPEELDTCRKALDYVDIISPNHAELCGFFGVEAHQSTGEIGIELHSTFEAHEADSFRICDSREVLQRSLGWHKDESNCS